MAKCWYCSARRPEDCDSRGRCRFDDPPPAMAETAPKPKPLVPGVAEKVDG